MKISGMLPLIAPALAGLLFIALYVPVFIWLVGVWVDDPYLSHGFMILPVSMFFVWAKRRFLKSDNHFLPGVYVFVTGIAVYVVGFICHYYWLWAFSFPISVSGLLLFFTGISGLRTVAFSVFFLIFMIPFPFLDLIGVPLQTIAASGSAWIVQLFGIPVTLIGAEVYLPDAAFTVGLPCSGMNTLVSLLAFSSLLLYCLKSSIIKNVGLFAITFPVAIIANIIRIALLLLIAHFWGTDTAMTYFHDYSSLILFIFAIVVLVLFTRLFNCEFKTLSELING